MATHAVSDRTLQKYWRKAVLKSNHNRCIICGLIKPDEALECHHVIRRNHRVTRHDYRNGVPVCIGDCHRFAHTEEGKHEIRVRLGSEEMAYLYEREKRFIKDYRLALSHSIKEHELWELSILKKRIAEWED